MQFTTIMYWSMSSRFMPGVRELENRTETELEELARDKLEEPSDKTGNYDLVYNKNVNESEKGKGAVYQIDPDRSSDWYENEYEDQLGAVDVDRELDINQIKINLITGETEIRKSNGEITNYNLISSYEGVTTLTRNFGEYLFALRYFKQGENEGELKGTILSERNQNVTEMNSKLVPEIRMIDQLYHQTQEKLWKTKSSEEVRMTAQNFTEEDARKELKLLDRAFENLKDSSVNSLLEFENKGVATVDRQDHPFTKPSTKNGSRGNEAARKFATRFNSLYNGNIVDYGLEVTIGDVSGEVRIKEDLEDEKIQVIGDLVSGSRRLGKEEIEDIVEERFRK